MVCLDSPLEGAGFEPSVPLEVLTVGIVPCRLRGPFRASSRKRSSQQTLRWRRQSGANSSLGGPNSLLAGNLQGISSTLASVARICRQNVYYNQSLTSKFPTRRNRELIGPYQGIKSAYQGSLPPNQGRALGWGFLQGSKTES